MMGRDVSMVCDRPFEEASGTGVKQLSMGWCSSLHSPPSGRRGSGKLAQLKTVRISLLNGLLVGVDDRTCRLPSSAHFQNRCLWKAETQRQPHGKKRLQLVIASTVCASRSSCELTSTEQRLTCGVGTSKVSAAPGPIIGFDEHHWIVRSSSITVVSV